MWKLLFGNKNKILSLLTSSVCAVSSTTTGWCHRCIILWLVQTVGTKQGFGDYLTRPSQTALNLLSKIQFGIINHIWIGILVRFPVTWGQEFTALLKVENDREGRLFFWYSASHWYQFTHALERFWFLDSTCYSLTDGLLQESTGFPVSKGASQAQVTQCDSQHIYSPG